MRGGVTRVHTVAVAAAVAAGSKHAVRRCKDKVGDETGIRGDQAPADGTDTRGGEEYRGFAEARRNHGNFAGTRRYNTLLLGYVARSTR